MNLSTYEKLILSSAMHDRGVMFKLAPELPEIAFGYGPGDTESNAHRLIYRSMLELFQEKQQINVASIAVKLGKSTNLVGGESYLVEISQTLRALDIGDTSGLPLWSNVVDGAGRLRLLQGILVGSAARLEDIETAITKIEDVGEFVQDLLTQIGNANSVISSYRPITEAAAEFRNYLTTEASGEAITWLPVGWQASKKYRLLPRASLVTVIGLSSIGKSQLLAQFLLGAAIQLKLYNLPGVCTLNTYEMKGHRFVGRMASCLSGVNLLSPALQDTSSDEYNRLMLATEFIEELPILWDEGDMTSTQIVCDTISLAAERGGVHVVGVDYSELVPDKGTSEELRLSNIYRNCQSLSRQLDAAVVVLSQVSGDAFTNDQRIAGPWATRYSKAGWHAAEVLLEVYNPVQMRKQNITFTLPKWLPSENKAYVLVHKNKNGPTGWFSLNWTPGIVRFADPSLPMSGIGGLYEGLEKIYPSVRDDF